MPETKKAASTKKSVAALTKSKAWKTLRSHYTEVRDLHLRDIFAADPQRGERLTIEAEARLHEHHWPGNVRELMHVLERGAILSGDRMEIGADEIRFRRASRS